MSLEQRPPPRLQIDLGTISVTGARPGTGAGLDRQVREVLGRTLAEPGLSDTARSLDIARLTIDVPAGAGDAEIAQAIGHAVRRQLRGRPNGRE